MNRSQVDHEEGEPAPVLYTVPETTARLRISRAKVHQLLASGELDSITIGRRRLVPDTALAAYIRGRMRDTRREHEGDDQPAGGGGAAA